jgi:hypothetical protein
MQGNKESMIQPRWIDWWESDRVLAKICNPWIWKQNENISISIINNVILRIIPREHKFDFHYRTGEINDQVWDVPVGQARRSLAAGITSLLSNLTFNEEISNISNLSWMKRTDDYLILLTIIGIWTKSAENDTDTLVSARTNIDFQLPQILVNWTCLSASLHLS